MTKVRRRRDGSQQQMPIHSYRPGKPVAFRLVGKVEFTASARVPVRAAPRPSGRCCDCRGVWWWWFRNQARLLPKCAGGTRYCVGPRGPFGVRTTSPSESEERATAGDGVGVCECWAWRGWRVTERPSPSSSILTVPPVFRRLLDALTRLHTRQEPAEISSEHDNAWCAAVSRIRSSSINSIATASYRATMSSSMLIGKPAISVFRPATEEFILSLPFRVAEDRDHGTITFRQGELR